MGAGLAEEGSDASLLPFCQTDTKQGQLSASSQHGRLLGDHKGHNLVALGTPTS